MSVVDDLRRKAHRRIGAVPRRVEIRTIQDVLAAVGEANPSRAMWIAHGSELVGVLRASHRPTETLTYDRAEFIDRRALALKQYADVNNGLKPKNEAEAIAPALNIHPSTYYRHMAKYLA